MEMVSRFCINSIAWWKFKLCVGDIWIIVYVMYMLIWMMVSLEGLVLYLLCENEWRIFKRNAAEISNDHLMDVMCIFPWIIRWLMDVLISGTVIMHVYTLSNNDVFREVALCMLLLINNSICIYTYV